MLPMIWITIPAAATKNPIAFSFVMSDNGALLATVMVLIASSCLVGRPAEGRAGESPTVAP